jgi:hypothetical protein
MATRADRLVENEKAFRMANERLLEAVGDGNSSLPFLCECADDTCLERVELDLDTYREIRSNPNCFFRLPGHMDAPGERVVASHPGYEVIDKEDA